MIRSVLLENLLRFCLCSQPTNIPCLEQSDAITVNCYQNNNTQDSRTKSSLVDYWMLDNLIRFIFSPFVSSQYLGRCASPTVCSQILLINQVDNGTPGLWGQCHSVTVSQCHINTLALLIYWLVGRKFVKHKN